MDKQTLKGKHVLALIAGTELLGSERGNMEALQSMQRNGAHITVAVSSRTQDGGSVGEFARSVGFETFNLPYGSHFAWSWMLHDRGYRNRQFKRLWTNSRLLHQAIKKHRPTHLLIGTTTAYIFVALALMWNRTPLIYRMGDAPVVESKFQMFLWQRLLSRSSLIVSVSDFISNQIVHNSSYPAKKIKRIYNVPISRKGNINKDLTSKLSEMKRPFQLIYVGQITEKKGVVCLIDALLQLNDPMIGCWITGGSQHTLKLEEALKDRIDHSGSKTKIEFLGFKNDPRPYYAAADWHFAPSIYEEPLGNIVQEAKQMKTPSIVSNNGGLPELIEHGKDGFILNDVNAQELTSTIKNLYKIEADWRSMGDAAKASLNPKFSHETFDHLWSEVVLNTKKKSYEQH